MTRRGLEANASQGLMDLHDYLPHGEDDSWSEPTVFLIVERTRLPVHEHILCANSNVFRKLINDVEERPLELEQCFASKKLSEILLLLKYLYGRLDLQVCPAKTLVPLAHEYDMPLLLNHCDALLALHAGLFLPQPALPLLTSRTLPELLGFSSKYSLKLLKEQCCKFASHSVTFLHMEEYSKEVLQALDSDTLQFLYSAALSNFKQFVQSPLAKLPECSHTDCSFRVCDACRDARLQALGLKPSRYQLPYAPGFSGFPPLPSYYYGCGGGS